MSFSKLTQICNFALSSSKTLFENNSFFYSLWLISPEARGASSATLSAAKRYDALLSLSLDLHCSEKAPFCTMSTRLLAILHFQLRKNDWKDLFVINFHHFMVLCNPPIATACRYVEPYVILGFFGLATLNVFRHSRYLIGIVKKP